MQRCWTDIIEGLMVLVPDFKGQMELRREVPRSARTYHQVLDWMKKLIDQDEEKLHQIQQEEAFARQLGTSTQKGLTAQAEEGAPEKLKTGGDGGAGGAAAEKTKEFISQKGRQISALAGQLKQAGYKPDFAVARRGRSEERKGGGKGKKKGKALDYNHGSREPSASSGKGRECWNCGATDHLKASCPHPPRASSPAGSATSGATTDSEARKAKMPCFNH